MKLVCIIAISFLFSSLLFGISSTTTGGDWHSNSTWQGGVVPGIDDDVFIHGIVDVWGSVDCHDLTIVCSDGMLRNDPLSHGAINVFGNLTNYGFIANGTDSSYYLTVNLHGNLNICYNFIPQVLNLQGSGNRDISALAGFSFGVEESVTVAAGIDTLFLNTDVAFSTGSPSGNTTITGNGNPYVICAIDHSNTPHNVNFTNFTVIDAHIKGGSGSACTWSSPRLAYLMNSTLENVTISSPNSMLLHNGVTLKDVVNNATVYNYSNSNKTVTVYGSLTNYGQIRGNPGGYAIILNTYGNLHNYGTLNPHSINMMGTDSRILSCSPSTPFKASSQIVISAEVGTIYAGTDLYFSNTSLLSGGSFQLYSEGRIAYSLFGINTDFSGCTFMGASGSVINGSNCAFTNASMNTIRLEGENRFANGCLITGITNYGTMYNHYSTNSTLNVYGTFQNYGTIRNHPSGYNLYMNAYGDVHNYGTWYNLYLALQNPTSVTLTFPTEHQFAGAELIVANSSCHVYLSGSSFKISGCTFDLNSAILHLPSGAFTFGLNVSTMRETSVLSTLDNILDFSDGSIIQQTSLQSITNIGYLSINSSITLNGDLVNNGTIRNHHTTNQIFTVTGYITNNGIFRNHPSGYGLTVLAGGNVINNGTWMNYTLELNGVATQYITFGSGHPFAGTYLNDTVSSSALVVTGDTYITNCTVDLNNSIINLMTAGDWDLHLTNTYLKEAIIASTMNSTLRQTEGGYIDLCSFQSIEFDGTVTLHSNTVFTGSLLNSNILQNNSNGNKNLTIQGNLLNNGTIKGNPSGYSINLFFNQDIINNGTISVNNLYFNGLTQHLTNTGSITSPNISAVSSGISIYLDTNLTLTNCSFSLNNATLRMNNRSSSILTMDGGYIRDFTIQGGGELHGSSGFYLQNMNADALTTDGTILTNNATVGDLLNNGTIKNLTWSNYTLNVTGNLTNNGSIVNNSSYGLYVNCGGNLLNQGILSCQQVNINGTSNQRILRLGTLSPISFILHSGIGDSQWYKNGIITSYTGASITIPITNDAVLGIWQPYNISSLWGREIIITVSSELSVPENLSISESGGIITLLWNEVPGAISYCVYASDTPDGEFSLLESGITDPAPGNGTAGYSLPASDACKFYQVTAED